MATVRLDRESARRRTHMAHDGTTAPATAHRSSVGHTAHRLRVVACFVRLMCAGCHAGVLDLDEFKAIALKMAELSAKPKTY